MSTTDESVHGHKSLGLCEDFATLKQEIAADVKELKREVVDLGRVDTLEQKHDAQKEELDYHRRELLTLQDKNQELQYQLEDLEKRLHCSDIRTKGHQQLEDDIKALEVAQRQAGSLATRRQLTTLRKQLRALDEDKAEYALLQIKQKFYAGGNRVGHLLAHRLCTQATEWRVADLRLPSGTLTCQEELFRHQFERFYSDLYSTEELDHKGMEDHPGEKYDTHRSPREHTPAAAG
ncbi:hypothetical protein NDU88_005043 [Pleurodeles waltl]|uniref:Uncharacterized protein n=1 Tax=Pleurodeles waltl TaxID=8319 RepID=A0AAV7QH75_PLEWA|nr:hypothetical protein NDU88_005043 [Pleurodeles waltl]